MHRIQVHHHKCLTKSFFHSLNYQDKKNQNSQKLQYFQTIYVPKHLKPNVQMVFAHLPTLIVVIENNLTKFLRKELNI